ncbi:MAG: SDR family NAD(P)-dependent oxidoreductase [Pseudonocardiaceae bacterium]
MAAVFAADGNSVVITGRRPEPLQTTAAQLGVKVRAVVCDGTDPAQVEALRVQLPESVDVLVHCADGNTDVDRHVAGRAVINIGSIAADQGAGSYGAAKAGVASWNIDLAAELGPRGVTANVVAPGYTADTEFFRDKLTDQRREALIAATSTGRASAPDDVAATVHFLASPAARQITGQVLAVNGGERTTR